MLRLDLKDENETVLFIEPFKGVTIHKTVSQDNGLYVEYFDHIAYVTYDSVESRDAAYEYVLNKINEYIFPQMESCELEEKLF